MDQRYPASAKLPDRAEHCGQNVLRAMREARDWLAACEGNFKFGFLLTERVLPKLDNSGVLGSHTFFCLKGIKLIPWCQSV